MTLVNAILELIQASPEPLSEYQLLQQLKSRSDFKDIADSCSQQPQLSLFRQHFLLMNSLYQLQNKLWREKKYTLLISPLTLSLQPWVASDSVQLQDCANQNLSQYYLDWDNYNDTAAEDVDQLLSDFWVKFSQPEKIDQALQTLELSADSSREQITKRYRQLASAHHPDKGGCKNLFIRVREAYEVLTR